MPRLKQAAVDLPMKVFDKMTVKHRAAYARHAGRIYLKINNHNSFSSLGLNVGFSPKQLLSWLKLD